MDEINLISLIVQGAPNFVGFALLAWMMNRTLNRMIDLVARCLDDKDEDE